MRGMSPAGGKGSTGQRTGENLFWLKSGMNPRHGASNEKLNPGARQVGRNLLSGENGVATVRPTRGSYKCRYHSKGKDVQQTNQGGGKLLSK